MYNSPLFSDPLYIYNVYTYLRVFSVSLSLEYQTSLNMSWIALIAATFLLMHDNTILIIHATRACIHLRKRYADVLITPAPYKILSSINLRHMC